MADPIENLSEYCPSIFRRNPLASGISIPTKPPAGLVLMETFQCQRGRECCQKMRLPPNNKYRARIKFYAVGNGGLKSNAEIHIPKIIYLQIGCEGRLPLIPANIVREVAEVICSLNKSAYAECLVDGVKALCSQCAKKFPVFCKIIFVSCSGSIR